MHMPRYYHHNGVRYAGSNTVRAGAETRAKRHYGGGVLRLVPPRRPEGTSEAGRTSVVSPSASVALVDGFHGGGLGISDVLVGEGIPLVEVNGYKAQYEISKRSQQI